MNYGKSNLSRRKKQISSKKKRKKKNDRTLHASSEPKVEKPLDNDNEVYISYAET